MAYLAAFNRIEFHKALCDAFAICQISVGIVNVPKQVHLIPLYACFPAHTFY